MANTVYLANPYGFSTQQKTMLLPLVVAALEELGLEVWEPFARNNQVDFTQAGWAYEIGQKDFATYETLTPSLPSSTACHRMRV